MQETNAPFVITTGIGYIGGNPCIYRKPIFDKIQTLYKTSELKDPELTMFEAKKQVFSDSDWRVKSKDAIHIPGTFIDLGRPWRAERGIDKENKYSDKTVTWHIR